MPATLPDGDPVPPDGALPDAVRAELTTRPLSFYVHVPYCASRCGYCDFNTYTAAELGGGASQAAYASDAIAEIDLARKVFGDADVPVRTVFFGGGTPTLLPPADLAAILRAISDRFGLTQDAEISTEANPESIDARGLAELRDAGFTRVSFGMQSAREHVLAVLEREHTPGLASRRVAEAKACGFEHVNLDLIYGTPGESDDDWRASLESAIAAGPDHISAYSLIVEAGTRFAARVGRGEIVAPDDDVLADRYVLADEILEAAGFSWYEVSNWAKPGGQCQHNLAYWRGDHWWGVGPGAHSHVAGLRWWNVKHPRAYATRLAAGRSPGYAREHLDAGTRHLERVMLALRLAEGLDVGDLDDSGMKAATAEAKFGLLDTGRLGEGRAVLTRTGRLLADGVARRLLG